MKFGFISDLGKEAWGWRSTYLARRPLLVALLLYGSILFILSHTRWWTHPAATDPVQWVGQRVSLTGIVAAPPDLTPRGGQLLVEAETIRIDTSPFSVMGMVRVQVSKVTSNFANPGDRISVRGRLSQPTTSRVPGMFDFGEYLASHGIHSNLFAGARSFQNTGNSGSHRCLRLGWRLNQLIVDVFERRLPAEEAAILSGLVAGRRPRFQTEVKRVFIESGTMHVLVASGSNVAFVVALWYFFIRLMIRIPRRWVLVSSLPAVWTYAFLAGLDAPILRAALMATIGFIAHALTRQDKPIHALGLTALVLLIFDPRLISDLGFQMSFLTVTGFVLTLPAIAEKIPTQWRWRRWILQAISTAVTAEIWLLPITINIFKRLYPFSLLANMIVVPLSEGGLLAGLGLFSVDRLAAWSPIFEKGAQVIAVSVSLYGKLLFFLAQFFADHPGRVFWFASVGTVAIIGYYLVCISVIHFRNSAWAKVGTGVGVICVVWGLFQKLPSQKNSSLQITWIDAGRAIAALIETPSRQRVLILSSPTPHAEIWEKALLPYLSERGIRQLNLIVVPSPLSTTDKRRIRPWINIGQWMEGSPGCWMNENITVETLPPADAYTHDPPVIVHVSSTTILLTKGLGLATQDELLGKMKGHVSVVQGSFPFFARWRDEFVQRNKPELIVETEFDSENHPSSPPWESPLAVPQKTGIFIWKERVKTEEDFDGKS